MAVPASGEECAAVHVLRNCLTAPAQAAPTIVDALATRGWALCSSGFDVSHILKARDEIHAVHASGVATTGRMSADVTDHCAWRGDSVVWLGANRKAEMPAAVAIDAALGALCTELDLHLRARGEIALSNRHDAQLSVFPGNPGSGGFRKHYDTKTLRFGGRKITLIVYLNPPGWCNGGQLRIYADETMHDGSAPVDVEPTAGTVVVMRADLPHEVLPATASRVALTVWVDGNLLDKHPSYDMSPHAAAPCGMVEACHDDKRRRSGLRRYWPFW